MINLSTAIKYYSYPIEQEIESLKNSLGQEYECGNLDPIRGDNKTKGFSPEENAKLRKFAAAIEDEEMFISQNIEAYHEALELKEYIENFFENDNEVISLEVWNDDVFGIFDKYDETKEKFKFVVVVYSKYCLYEFNKRKYSFFRKSYSYLRKLKYANLIAFEVVDKYNTLN